ncbi:MAG: S-adenosylmethionine:tRNA ribosyltransferase-isomerase [Bacteroidales bacterium]|nr:S-adenosylmethionine:tRNA ribosyltransferase-isomerase [Bacteroidales bacterium]MDD4068133.1 S-adenosylmethionine:tRNA ribosyltransferase-isomerase [Bacteroidales bacterium]MDD4739131.1 S-adenosylmethionine:tRNA ribosyltransferase-isomerase [Bacteroidales bacterium]
MIGKSLDIAIKDFDYDLPSERIAKFPLEERDKAKLLVLNKDVIQEKTFFELPDLLDKDSLLIFNETRVVHARLFFQKTTGSIIEIFCLEPTSPNEIQIAMAQKGEGYWLCFIGNNKKWKEGSLSKTIIHNGKEITLSAKRESQKDNAWIVKFTWTKEYSFAEVLSIMGVIPLPPYLNREATNEDNEDYQTIYAKQEGSVAAPTAGLHFTEKTFEDLKQKEIASNFITLHVGAGTFKPVSSELIIDHVMHAEKVAIPKQVIQNLIEHLDKKIICVGTTSVRTIESLYWHGVKLIENKDEDVEIDISQWEPYQKEENITPRQALGAIVDRMNRENVDLLCGQTQIIIAPTYKYRIVKAVVTNFHQPKSTLLLLVSALIGDKWKDCYKFALENNFRFLSFGDACYFEP